MEEKKPELWTCVYILARCVTKIFIKIYQINLRELMLKSTEKPYVYIPTMLSQYILSEYLSQIDKEVMSLR